MAIKFNSLLKKVSHLSVPQLVITQNLSLITVYGFISSLPDSVEASPK